VRNPWAPDRVSIALDDLLIDRQGQATGERIFAGKHAELHGRLASGSVRNDPVIDLAMKLVAATAPTVHPLAAQPFDADVDATLRGLKDFGPRTWPERFRQLQQAGGRIEVRSLRLRQGEAFGVAVGSLGLTPNGRLDGELQMTVAGLEKVLPSLSAEQLTRPGSTASERLGTALGALDRVVPGLGNLARGRAGAGVAAGLALMGEPAELEGRRAVKLPLRFTDGDVHLGPFRVGQTGPLF
jgi:hypothetical protein